MPKRAYVIGSASDPVEENRRKRAEVESPIRDTLVSSGVPEWTAIEVAGAVVATYLLAGTEEALYVIKHLSNSVAVRTVIQLRAKVEG